jgi:hypothetical protein
LRRDQSSPVFFLYRVNRRDERIKEIREGMVAAKARAAQLDMMITYELAYDIVEKTISSRTLLPFLHNLYLRHFRSPTDQENSIKIEEFDQYMDKNMPLIFGSIQSEKVAVFEGGLREIEVIASKLDFDVPGLARCLYAGRNILGNVFRGQKGFAFSEDAWKRVISVMGQRGERFENFDLFQSRLIQVFVGLMIERLANKGQNTINDVLECIDIIVKRYLEKSPRDFIKAARIQCSRELVPINQTSSVSQDLSEAEKGVDGTLPNTDLMRIRQLWTQIETRYEDDQDQSS